MNLILTDNAENVFQGNVAMQVTQPVFLVAQLTIDAPLHHM